MRRTEELGGGDKYEIHYGGGAESEEWKKRGWDKMKYV